MLSGVGLVRDVGETGRRRCRSRDGVPRDNASVPTPRTHRPGRRAAVAVAACLVVVTASACGDDGGGGNAERFCGEIAENETLLTDPQLAYSDDIGPLLDLYRRVADLAPLAIEDEWRQLVATYETASTVVPDDEASMQTALAAAYQSEGAALAVATWLRDNCAVEFGPITTIAPHS